MRDQRSLSRATPDGRQGVRRRFHYPCVARRLLLIGHNPSDHAWHSGHFYSNPTNRMWPLLRKSGCARTACGEASASESRAALFVFVINGRAERMMVPARRIVPPDFEATDSNSLAEEYGVGVTGAIDHRAGGQTNTTNVQPLCRWQNSCVAFRRTQTSGASRGATRGSSSGRR